MSKHDAAMIKGTSASVTLRGMLILACSCVFFVLWWSPGACIRVVCTFGMCGDWRFVERTLRELKGLLLLMMRGLLQL